MTKYREILRLKHLGFSERNIARTAGVSCNTVKRVVEAATAAKIDWTHAESMDDATIEKALFPDRKPAQPSHTVDFEYTRKELLRNGVTKKLLWTEYCESCRLCNREPLMYSQFCHYIQQEEQKRRATMHIPRRLAEFADHARIAQRLNVGYYFAHPYHSWERGANENMNGLIRQYLPKGTSFEDLTREEVKWIEWKLNNRPRKRLGFMTPLEYISRQVKQIYLAT